MNENLNLCKILKDCLRGTELWSSVWGDVSLVGVKEESCKPITLAADGYNCITTYSNGKIFNIEGAECIVFPSKGQRDWSKFKAPIKRFDPKDFKPFDKVLIKHNYENERWVCNFFSGMLPNGEVSCIGVTVYECIPYNDETKHLVGTTDECPEYYKWWEE